MNGSFCIILLLICNTTHVFFILYSFSKIVSKSDLSFHTAETATAFLNESNIISRELDLARKKVIPLARVKKEKHLKKINVEMKNYKEGDLIFGKVFGFSYWPAKIIQIKTCSFQVIFFGTHEL